MFSSSPPLWPSPLSASWDLTDLETSSSEDAPPDYESLRDRGHEAAGAARAPDLPPSYALCQADDLARQLQRALGTPEEFFVAKNLLTRMAEGLAERGTDQAFQERSSRLLHPAVVDMVTRLLIERDANGLAGKYAELLWLLLRDQVLPKGDALAALTQARRPDRRPPLLLQLATMSRWSTRQGVILARLVIAMAPRDQPALGRFRTQLLALASPHGLSEQDKYIDFYGRLARDGELLTHRQTSRNPQGALACLDLLRLNDLEPADAESQAALVSSCRTRKIRRGFHAAWVETPAREPCGAIALRDNCVTTAARLAGLLRLEHVAPV